MKGKEQGLHLENRKFPFLAFAALGVLVASASAVAHHSDSLYDQDHLITVTGAAAQFEFQNPHDLIYLDVIDDQGNLQQWIVLGSSLAALAKVGWNRRTIQSGEQLTITGFQRKDGRRGMLHLKIVRANSEVLPAGEAETNYLKGFAVRQSKSKSSQKPDR